jgi:hypothetical protein
MQMGQAEMRAAAKSANLDCLEEHMTALALQNTTNNDHAASCASTLSNPQHSEKMCVVCMEREKSVVLMPCLHLCICQECTDQLIAHSGRKKAMCPVCRQLIQNHIKPFM